MNVPANVTRAAGDVHALGNPHFMTDPIIAKAVAQHIATAFGRIDPAHKAAYDANYQKFESTINAKLQEWGTSDAAVQRATNRVLSRFVALLRPSLRYRDRHLSGAKAGNSAIAGAPRGGDRDRSKRRR